MRPRLLPIVVLLAFIAGCSSDEPLVDPSAAPVPDTPPEVTEEFRAFNQDRDAQKLLGQANGVASRYFDERDTFEGFDAAAARELEPAITWTPRGEPPGTLAVGINEATDDHVLLVTRSQTGSVFCEVGEPDGHVSSTGSRNARSAAGCRGGWG